MTGPVPEVEVSREPAKRIQPFVILWVVLDAILVCLFGAIGKSSHDGSAWLFFDAAWPFLVGLGVGWLAVGCALIGVFLPILPTVPFLLIALWAFGRSSERLREKLLADPVFGPDIRRWQERGAIRRSAKLLSVTAMAGSVAISLALGVPARAVIIQAIILSAVAVFIITRPEA